MPGGRCWDAVVDMPIVLGFALSCVVLNLVPGPGMMFTIAQGVSGGRRAGVISAAGMASGTVVHTVAAALGLSALLSAAPAALDVVRVGGAGFLLYLAVDTFRSAKRPIVVASGRPPRSLGRVYRSAVLTNLANPKVVLFYLAFVPQFVSAGGWPTSLQILALGGVLIVIGLVMDSSVGIAAGMCSVLLRGRPSIQRWVKRVSATIFAGLAVRLLVTEAQ
jgi:threonine/homoserine/homoserine lactone efflux protein